MSHKITSILSRKMMIALVCLLLVGGFATFAFAYTQANSASASSGCPKTISYGSRGESVTQLQKILNYRFNNPRGGGYFNNYPYKFHYPLKVDGVFGSDTQKAVKDYQYYKKLHVDGVVGPHTWYALGYPLCPKGK